MHARVDVYSTRELSVTEQEDNLIVIHYGEGARLGLSFNRTRSPLGACKNPAIVPA